VKLNVNLITKGHFWDAGTEVPDHLIPVWCIKKHRCGDVEAAEICRRREELRGNWETGGQGANSFGFFPDRYILRAFAAASSRGSSIPFFSTSGSRWRRYGGIRMEPLSAVPPLLGW
jgi:hypothetical protein